MTLKELLEHPERASEEDLKSLGECFRLVKEMGKTMEPLTYGITQESGRSKEEIAYGDYVDTMLMAVILESFTLAPSQEYKEINKFVFNYTDKAFIWDLPVTMYYKCLAKLCAVGLLKMTREDKYNPSFAITDEGYVALRQQTYANLAQTALFNLKTQQLNDQTLVLNKRAMRLNWKMLAVAIVLTVVAIVGVIATLRD